MFTEMNVTPTVQSILELLARDPMKQFYQREIAKEAKISVGAANKLLDELVRQELIILEKRGKMFFYRINLRSPVARQFKILFNIMLLDVLVKALRDHCKRIVLFGSCADGTDVKESDIDLFVLTQEKGFVLKTINKYERGITRRIAPIVLTIIEWTNLKRKDKSLYDNISKGLILWEEE